jgi:plastocyanin
MRMRSIALCAGCLGLLAVPTTVGAANTHVVATGDFFFKPKRLEIVPGDTVTWKFADETHNLASRKGAPEKVRSGDKDEGTTYSFTFTKPGRYSYECTIHLGLMDGVVQVGPDTTPPKLTKAKAKRGKKSVRVSFRLSEDAKVKASVKRAGKTVKTIRTKALAEGARSVVFKPKKLTPGRYRVTLAPTDIERNAGKAVSAKFTVPKP